MQILVPGAGNTIFYRSEKVIFTIWKSSWNWNYNLQKLYELEFTTFKPRIKELEIYNRWAIHNLKQPGSRNTIFYIWKSWYSQLGNPLIISDLGRNHGRWSSTSGCWCQLRFRRPVSTCLLYTSPSPRDS